jgi:hypothetical protein
VVFGWLVAWLVCHELYTLESASWGTPHVTCDVSSIDSPSSLSLSICHFGAIVVNDSSCVSHHVFVTVIILILDSSIVIVIVTTASSSSCRRHPSTSIVPKPVASVTLLQHFSYFGSFACSSAPSAQRAARQPCQQQRGIVASMATGSRVNLLVIDQRCVAA